MSGWYDLNHLEKMDFTAEPTDSLKKIKEALGTYWYAKGDTKVRMMKLHTEVSDVLMHRWLKEQESAS